MLNSVQLCSTAVNSVQHRSTVFNSVQQYSTAFNSAQQRSTSAFNSVQLCSTACVPLTVQFRRTGTSVCSAVSVRHPHATISTRAFSMRDPQEKWKDLFFHICIYSYLFIHLFHIYSLFIHSIHFIFIHLSVFIHSQLFLYKYFVNKTFCMLDPESNGKIFFFTSVFIHFLKYFLKFSIMQKKFEQSSTKWPPKPWVSSTKVCLLYVLKICCFSNLYAKIAVSCC